jgi:general secretion pathway protein K
MTWQSCSRERGWALISVLWSMTMLAVMAAATEQLVIIGHRAERRAWDRLQASAVLDGALTEAVAGIENPGAATRWRVDGIPRRLNLQGFSVTAIVQDEAGRFDLNVIDGHTLWRLLQNAGLSSEESEVLSDSILNWRAPAGLHALKGATDDDYKTAGVAYHPRHGDFQSVGELQLVLGMTKPVFQSIRPALTVYTKHMLIDPAVAPREALLALYDGNAAQADARIAQRNGAASDQEAAALDGPPAVVVPVAHDWQGRVYDINLETLLSGRICREDVIVLLTGDNRKPYLILGWRV